MAKIKIGTVVKLKSKALKPEKKAMSAPKAKPATLKTLGKKK